LHLQGHPYMISLWEHTYLWRTIAGLYAFVFLLAADAVPDLGDTVNLVSLPTEELRVAVLTCMALDVAAVVVVERSLRWVVAKLRG
jgi:hypothetical protein